MAFVTIVFAYTGMFYSIRVTASRTAQRSVCSQEVAIAKRFFFIVITDALCWIPIFLLKLLSLLQVEIPGEGPGRAHRCQPRAPGWGPLGVGAAKVGCLSAGGEHLTRPKVDPGPLQLSREQQL